MALSAVSGAKLVKCARSVWVSRPSPFLFLSAIVAHGGTRGVASLHGVTCSSVSLYGAAFSKMQGLAKSCAGSGIWRQHVCAGAWSVVAFKACGQPLHLFCGGRVAPSNSWQKANETALECSGGEKPPVVHVGAKLDERGGLEIENLGLEGITSSVPRGNQEAGNGRIGKEQEGMGDIEKVCDECQVTKPLRNFERSTTSPDGRHILCRACLARFRNKRGGRPLHHLAMPVAESWEKAKVCSKCRQVQEMRDFCRNIRAKDGLATQCRSCRGEYREQLSYKPVAETAWCNQCGVTKPACKFSRIKGKKDGLNSTCTECIVALRKEARKSGLPLKMYVQVQEKVCIACGAVKTSKDFSKDAFTMDGLHFVCKACKKSYNQRAYLSRKQSQAD